MNSIPVATVDARIRGDSNLSNAPSVIFKSENENASDTPDRKTPKADDESFKDTLSETTINVTVENGVENFLESVEMKQNEFMKPFLGSTLILRGSSGVVDQAQAGINSDRLRPATAWRKPSRSIKSKRVKTLYTAQAPIEIISFFYRMGREAKERDSCESIKYRLEDTPIPEPKQYERSLVRAISDSASFDWDAGTPSSEVSNYKFKSINHVQILQRSLSWLGQTVSQVSSDQSLVVKTPKRFRTRNPSSFSLDEDDIKMLAEESTEMSQKSLTPKMRNLSLSNREVTLDSVGENYSTEKFPKLSNLGFGRAHGSNLSKRSKRSNLYPPVRRHIRCNSSDFAFTDANEISQVNVSSITTSKDAKEYLTYEEKEERDPFLNMLWTHLTHGKSKRLVSRSMRRSRRQRDAMRREKLSNVLSERESDSLIVGALLRAATDNYEYISRSQAPLNGRRKISGINQNMHLRISSIDEEKAVPPH